MSERVVADHAEKPGGYAQASNADGDVARRAAGSLHETARLGQRHTLGVGNEIDQQLAQADNTAHVPDPPHVVSRARRRLVPGN